MSILCATDFSPCAQKAADVAVLLAQKLSLPLRLVHCAEDALVIGDLPVPPPDDHVLTEELRTEAERLRQKGASVIEELRHGGVIWELVTAAQEQATELLVLGSTGKGMAERWLIGSVAEAVAEKTPVPCLVVRRPEVLLAWMHGRLELEVLCAVDLGASSDSAITWLGTLAAAGPAKLEAVRVLPTGEEGATPDLHHACERAVREKVRASVGDCPLEVRVTETTGRPAQDFLGLAEERNPGLVVIGSRQHHGLSRIMSPSFSRRVLAHATGNVLCVPSHPKVSKEAPCVRRVLVATDLGELAADTVRHARSLLPGGGAIHLLHVCHDPSPGLNPAVASAVYFDHSLAMAKMRESVMQKVNELSSSMTGGGVTISTEVLSHNNVAAAICAAAGRVGADVICMGSKGHSRLGAALLGSTVQSVLAHAGRPVFVVPPSQS